MNPKIQVSNHLLLPCSLVCIGPGLSPRKQFFSRRGSKMYALIAIYCPSSWICHSTSIYSAIRHESRRHKSCVLGFRPCTRFQTSLPAINFNISDLKTRRTVMYFLGREEAKANLSLRCSYLQICIKNVFK